jgi:hypothetical protein
MRQVTLVVQVEDDDEVDEVMADLVDFARQYEDDLAEAESRPLISDIFVADDLGTVSRP